MTIHPTIYGTKESFTFAFCSTLPAINCIPNIIPTIIANAKPINNNMLYTLLVNV